MHSLWVPPAFNLGVTTPRLFSSQCMVMYQRCSRLHSEHRSFRFLHFLPQTRTRSWNYSAPLGHWKSTWSVPPSLGSRTSSSFASVTAPKGVRSWSRGFQGGWLTLLRNLTLPWACIAPLEYEHTPEEALPHRGHGLAECPLQKYVRRPDGPRRPHSLGFITWKSLLYRHESFLLERTWTLTGGTGTEQSSAIARPTYQWLTCALSTPQGAEAV